MTNIICKSPLRWYGGKARLAQKLIRLFPEHTNFIDVFGGSASVLLQKQPCGLEILNDLDADLMHFWRVVKDRTLVGQLITRLQRTSIEREEYEFCNQLYDLCFDPVEKARMYMVLSKLSFNGLFRKGWSDTTPPAYRSSFPNAVARLEAVSRRLQSVTLDNIDFRELIKKYDNPDTCMYLDPPYISATRKVPNRYRYEMTNFDHEELARMLLWVKSSIVLSGYAHPIYDDKFKDWIRVPIPTLKHSAQGRSITTKPKAIEMVWIQPATGRRVPELAHELAASKGVPTTADHDPDRYHMFENELVAAADAAAV